MMEKCLLYKMVRYGEPGVPPLDPKKFKHAYTSKYGKIRIFKVMNVSLKSKNWVADPANRVCDAPGSWYCTGQYPPALKSLIAKRKPFRQLEDFNVEKDEASRKYVEEYHKRMEGRGGRRGADYDDYDGDMGGGDGGMGGGMAELMAQMGIAPLGCFGAEANLGADKVYKGGQLGAQLSSALQWAGSEGKRYVAIARSTHTDGHMFAFNSPPKFERSLESDYGCEAPCIDVDMFGCGCADGLCKENDAEPEAGESNARRWVVYEVPPEFIQAGQAAAGSRSGARRSGKGGSKKGKAKRAPKSEL